MALRLCCSRPASVDARATSAPMRLQLAARMGGDRGGAVLDRPRLDLAGEQAATRADPGFGSGERERRRGIGGGNHRLLLLDSEQHTETRVVAAITAVLPGVEEAHAANCFHTSRTLGVALICSALLEMAEHYQQQLFRRGCRVKIEPDTTTL